MRVKAGNQTLEVEISSPLSDSVRFSGVQSISNLRDQCNKVVKLQQYPTYSKATLYVFLWRMTRIPTSISRLNAPEMASFVSTSAVSDKGSFQQWKFKRACKIASLSTWPLLKHVETISWNWFPQESGTDPWCCWIEKWGFFFKTPWKMVNHHTRIIAVVDNIVIMRYHEHSSHHSRETRASLDSLKLPLIPGANVQPLQLHFALQRPEGSRLH